MRAIIIIIIIIMPLLIACTPVLAQDPHRERPRMRWCVENRLTRRPLTRNEGRSNSADFPHLHASVSRFVPSFCDTNLRDRCVRSPDLVAFFRSQKGSAGSGGGARPARAPAWGRGGVGT